MSNVVTGGNGIIEVKVAGLYYPVGCFTNFTFTFNNELILKTDVNSGLFRKRRVRLSDYSATIHGLTTLENDGETASVIYLLGEGVRRTEKDIRITFVDEGFVSKQIVGTFLIESINITGDMSNFSENDINLQGTSGFTISETDDSPGGDAGDLEPFSDWWTTTPGATTITGLGQAGRSFSGLDLLEVDREGLEYDIVTVAPGNREARYNHSSIITFAIPFEAGERVFVMWKGQLL